MRTSHDKFNSFIDRHTVGAHGAPYKNTSLPETYAVRIAWVKNWVEDHRPGRMPLIVRMKLRAARLSFVFRRRVRRAHQP